MQSSADGEVIAYEGTPFSASIGAAIENEYLARRDPVSGWQTSTLSPRLQGSGVFQGFKTFDSELTKGVLYQIDPTLSAAAPSGYANLYTQPTGDASTLSPLLEAAPPNRAPGFSGGNNFSLTYAGASADFSRQFFAANDALTAATAFAPAAVDGGVSKNNLYEWVDGELRLVNVLPGNAETVPGALFGAGNANAVSADGSRVFWSAGGQVYLREGAELTRAISTSGLPDPGDFLAASPDGSRVLLANGHLHDLDGAEQTTDLTQGNGGFLGLVGQSEDLSSTYFVDTAVLTGEEENAHGAKALAGKPNLYVWKEGSAVFIATLSVKDAPAWSSSASARMGEASPNGRWLAFLSRAPLTGFDNVGPCEVAGGGEVQTIPCNEAYLYDAATGDLLCASCSTSNSRPLGPSVLRLIKGAGGSIPQPRYLTDSGRLYFDSQDSLAPADTNGNVEDIYQYEPKGIGSCEREGGCVSLISGGRESVDSNFVAMDSSGNNVFFTSRDRLVTADTDSLIDLYDARVDGGFPTKPQPPPSEQASLPVPFEPSASSTGIAGPGNVKPQVKCKKGQVKRNGRCVKKPKHKKQKRPAKPRRGGSK